MKRALITGAICALLGSGLTALSIGEDQTNQEFWAAERGRALQAPRMAAGASKISPSRQEAARLVAYEARSQLGERWVPTALQITQVESGFRCEAIGPKTRHGRARGLMQVLPSSAESLERGSSGRLTDCATGARVGVAHMARCLALGALTPASMAYCHVSGKPAGRLNRKAAVYARSYQRLVAGARPVLVADSGWISLGSVSLFR